MNSVQFMKKILWVIFAFFAIGVGLYPLLFVLQDMSTTGLIGGKSQELVQGFWMVAFYIHIFLGGISLLVGWSQFSSKLRKRRLKLHRILGKIYVIAVSLSGLAGLYISFFADGGPIAQWGFTFLALAWLTTTTLAYISVRQGQITHHQKWMIRSYALTFAAVTLRMYIPLFLMLTDLAFIDSYRIIAWLCWVPNLLVAEWIIYKQKSLTLAAN